VFWRQRQISLPSNKSTRAQEVCRATRGTHTHRRQAPGPPPFSLPSMPCSHDMLVCWVRVSLWRACAPDWCARASSFYLECIVYE
jgi:hypothetical protein